MSCICDYELLFTADDDIVNYIDFPIYRIGEILPGNQLTWIKDPRKVDLDISGFKHF